MVYMWYCELLWKREASWCRTWILCRMCFGEREKGGRFMSVHMEFRVIFPEFFQFSGRFSKAFYMLVIETHKTQFTTVFFAQQGPGFFRTFEYYRFSWSSLLKRRSFPRGERGTRCLSIPSSQGFGGGFWLLSGFGGGFWLLWPVWTAGESTDGCPFTFLI